MIYNKAELGEDYGRVKVTAGNYNTQKLEYMANLSITDQVSARFAGYALKRDGYILNLSMRFFISTYMFFISKKSYIDFCSYLCERSN